MTTTYEDVEMKDLVFSPSSTLPLLKDIASLIEYATLSKNIPLIASAVRLTFELRRNLTAPMLSAFLNLESHRGSQAHFRLSSILSDCNSEENAFPIPPALAEEDEHDMEVDTGTSAVQTPTKVLLPEREYYCYLLVLLFLVDQKEYNKAIECSSAIISTPKSLYRRTLDVLSSTLYFYFSYIYELIGDLAPIRRTLLALHCVATRHYDELGQETLLNLLLRNYLHYNLYDQAEKLRSKALRFKTQSNQQFCRYLFYLGKIRTIQLQYTEAKESLLQADRKAPVAARGFRIQCNKWAILVRLLLGEIPERRIFVQKGMEKALRPYFELTNAARIGDLELFRNVAEKFGSTFSKDKTQNLIVRLRHSVIRVGLRNISISYSRISLADVAEKLRLNPETPVADVESMIAKAIRDGAIDAKLDHSNGWMLSKEPRDIYSTNEPKTAFHSRITFCLNMYNEAIQAMEFPINIFEGFTDEERRSWAKWIGIELPEDDGNF